GGAGAGEGTRDRLRGAGSGARHRQRDERDDEELSWHGRIIRGLLGLSVCSSAERGSMYYETDTNNHGLRYNPLKACVVPRPIGWISSLDAAGKVNVAPFSFFNLLSYDPPFVMFSAGTHELDGGQKGTAANIDATGEVVYNMATWAQKDQMNQTAMIVDRTVDEMAATGLQPEPSQLVRPPRIKGSPVHFECRLHQIVTLPGRKPASEHHLVI